MSAAREILAEDAGAAVGEIAGRAGVSRATFYRHFGSRAALLESVELEPRPDARTRILSAAKDKLMTTSLAELSMDELARAVGAEADKMIAEVQPLVDKGDYVQAVARLKDVSRALAGTPVAARARRQLNDLMAKPEVRAKVESAEKAARADEALAVAKDLQKQKKDEAAYARFKSITREFPDTDAAATAAAVVKRYEDDPAFAKRVVEKETGAKAKAALSMARSYRTARRLDQARQKYQSIIQEFPNSPYAQTAQQELSALGK